VTIRCRALAPLERHIAQRDEQCREALLSPALVRGRQRVTL
jgi:hypothetical protein